MRSFISVIPAKAGTHTHPAPVGSRFRENGAERWRYVCKLDEIPVLGARVIERTETDGGNVAVFRNDKDVVFALLDKCPHKGGPLSQGIVFGERVACPLHNWTIELKSGEAVAPDVGCAKRFSVKVDAGDVFVQL